ncbi:MAG TPA: DUF883 C-terminal domain-containing protein [Thermoanaerobaculia bacterium]|nr:DUF883 C-terminal domain-containing protein [Thermoanaerobaculia bacterium]
MAEETRSAAGDGPLNDTDETAGRFGRAKDYVNDQYTKASDAMRDSYNTVREKVEDVDFGAITDQVRSYVRSNPGKALLISVGIGFVVGLMLRRDEDED